jgi:hypothetical protein
MERALAVKKLGKLLGKSLGYRVNDGAPTTEDREAAKLDLPAALEARDKLKQQRDARYQQILAADSEYQALRAAHKVAQEQVDKLHSMMRHYKFTVGTSNGMFFHVKAEGDSWEDVIEKVRSIK